jgi:PKD repeat protein
VTYDKDIEFILVHTKSSTVIENGVLTSSKVRTGDGSGDGDDGGDDETNQKPDADFIYNPVNPSVGKSFEFNADNSEDPDGTIQSYEWDFGDGNSTTGKSVTHTYEEAGTYMVTLIVKDDDGATDTATKDVNVGGLVYNNDAIALDIDGDGTLSGVQFTVENKNDQEIKIVEITVNPENATVGGLNDPSSFEGQWESEFFVESDDTYTTDFNYGETLPYTFELSEANNQNDEPVLAANSNSTFSLYQFTDGSGGGTSTGSGIDISGESVDITLTMDDGSSSAFTINPVAQVSNPLTYVTGTGETDFDGAGSLRFGISNNGNSVVTIQNVSVDVKEGPAKAIRNNLPDIYNGEIFIWNYLDTGFRDENIPLDTYVELDDNVEIPVGQLTTTVKFAYFIKNNGDQVSVSGNDVTVTFGLTDGRQVTVDIDDI